MLKQLCSDYCNVIDPNTSDDKGYTALHYAVENAKTEIVQKILDSFKSRLDLQSQHMDIAGNWVVGVGAFLQQQMSQYQKKVEEIEEKGE
mmetsp:Transcript_20771/g.15281  ORF Transcript_20771/g.15281 Transcript_20771/m.15281 type:complete len:90 (+) Transcript_20771:202-471(+)